MRKRRNKHLAIVFILLGMFMSSAQATEWIDCNGKNLWVGLLVSFEDDHIIHFQLNRNNIFIDDIEFPHTYASTAHHRASINGASKSVGEVSLDIEQQNGVLEMQGKSYALVCDWSAFE